MSQMLQNADDVAKLSARTQAREAFFIEFAHTIRQAVPDVILMVTGGFRSRKGMQDAVLEGACDIVGLARPAVLEPSLPRDIILNENLPDEQAMVEARSIAMPWILKQLGVKSVGAGYETVRQVNLRHRRSYHNAGTDTVAGLVCKTNEEDGLAKSIDVIWLWLSLSLPMTIEDSRGSRGSTIASDICMG
jgi:tRNA-dihydrouridine synthase